MIDARIARFWQLRANRQCIMTGHFLNVVGPALPRHPFKEVEVVNSSRLHPGLWAVFMRCEFRLIETCCTADALGVTDYCQGLRVGCIVKVTADEGRVLTAREHVIDQLACLSLPNPLEALLGLQVRRVDMERDLASLTLQLH